MKFFAKLFANKKLLIIIISALIVVVGGTVTTVSVVNYRRTPVYRGMELSKEGENPVVEVSYNSSDLSEPIRKFAPNRTPRVTENAPSEGNGNGNPHEGGSSGNPHTDENPTGNPHRREDFEEAIESEIGVIIPEGVSIFAKPSETINVTVKISNPMFYEILSFTLNGRLYQTYEFQDGSDSETIIVKFTVSEESGLEELTIDAIKYVDGSTIKSARFDAERTLKIGVEYVGTDVPFVSGVQEIIYTTSFGVGFVLSDNAKLMDPDTGIFMYVYDGEKICFVSKLNLGQNLFPYTNVMMGSTYNYAIVGVFDLYDGAGKCSHILYDNELTTKDGYLFDQVEATYDSLAISFKGEEIETNGAKIVGIDLLKDDEVVKSLDETAEEYVFDGLLSNSEYVLQATYSYELTEKNASGEDQIVTHTKTIGTTCQTLERPTPEVEFTGVTPDQEKVAFDFSIVNETTELGNFKSLALYQGEELVKELDPTAREITDLLTNNDYIIKAVYEYDLIDGTGKHEIELQTEFHTLVKVAPVFSFDVNPSQITSESIAYKINLDDVDSTCTKYLINLYLIKDGEEPTKVASLETLEGTFNGLLSNNDYRVVIDYEYDLNDGEGSHAADLAGDVHTIAKLAPVLAFDENALTKTSSTISYKIDLTDTDSTSKKYTVWLYQTVAQGDDIMISSIEALEGTFDNLLADTQYQVYVECEYDLNDGVGTQYADDDRLVTTDKLTVPYVELTNAYGFNKTMTGEFTIYDPDGILNINSLEFRLYSVTKGLEDKDVLTLVQSTTEYSLLSTGNQVQLTYTDDNLTYRIYVIYKYDLNDGAGEHVIDETAIIEHPNFVGGVVLFSD